MRKIVVLTFISLDGVMQAPGGSQEDTADGFKFGGWSAPYFDEEMGEIMGEQMKLPFDLLLGRKTYDIFAGYWPKSTEPGADVLNRATKYVVSSGEPGLSWEKSVLISGGVPQKLKGLKNGDGPMLQVHGSSNLIQTLLQHDLIDELWLKIFPVTLGSGKRLFGEGTIPSAFKLTMNMATPSGIIVANYARDGDVKVGSMV